MFQDIVKLTQFTLGNALEDTTISLDMKSLYDAYRKMDSAIYAMYILEAHYLSIPLDSDFLQDSQHGTPFQKWYKVTEGDFDKVRIHLREFLTELVHVTYRKNEEDDEDRPIPIIEKHIRAKHIYGFFVHHYESGKLSKDGQSVICNKLILENNEFYKEVSIPIDTLEKRVALCQEIRICVEEMKQILQAIKTFILTDATLEELL